jgi:hypothetical protein
MLVSFHLEIVLILMQHRCLICAERNNGSEIILDAPDGTPRWGHVESSFGLFEGSISVGAR